MKINIKWKDIPRPAKAGLIGVGLPALIMLIIAQVDITKRDRKEMVGPKIFWRLVSLIEIIGPLLYFGMIKEVKKRLK